MLWATCGRPWLKRLSRIRWTRRPKHISSSFWRLGTLSGVFFCFSRKNVKGKTTAFGGGVPSFRHTHILADVKCCQDQCWVQHLKTNMQANSRHKRLSRVCLCVPLPALGCFRAFLALAWGEAWPFQKEDVAVSIWLEALRNFGQAA